ncbi:MAG: D-alanyl-D-alanine carboxypeptidase/D-alanyl-D-alanine-endopeptidase [Burkholderiales bacterium]|nr:D-alanyl-D-alanine carboxypeptidase/D-alanyl-D-alanine-endopeptidase [Burkholderiales bacterium]
MRPLLIAILAASAGAFAAPARAEPLPPEVAQALRRAHVPAASLAVEVLDPASGRRLFEAGAGRALNPASVTKLVTTYAALDLLGPGWRWSTPVWIQGRVRDGVLDGSLYLRGSGDPSLVLERVWLLLQRVREAGVREIGGDIVLDGSAFAPVEAEPGDFDGAPSRPYNAQPAALIFNFGAVRYAFVPDEAAGVAHVRIEPELADTEVQREVPLSNAPCADWRAALGASFGSTVRFGGRYPAACGVQDWPVADPRPASYNARLLAALWASMGGRLDGHVREGAAPADMAPSFEFHSPPLAEVVHDINKYSNNLMAQQLFYSLDLVRHPERPASAAGAREGLTAWLGAKLGPLPPGTVIDNGSGLSRATRLSPDLLARLLASAWTSPVMPELMASLPVPGVDGTLRRARGGDGRAHLKTGSLRGVAARAGYVLTDDGRRLVLVAIVDDPAAEAARPALDALVDWVQRGAKR